MAWAPTHHHHVVEPPSPPTTTWPRGSGPLDTRNMNMDANMTIILGVLLFALLCALGLNSVVRCALRCANRHPHQYNRREGGVAYVGAGSRGLKSSTIRQIPTTIYHIANTTATNKAVHNNNNNNNNNVIMSTDCMICLGEFLEGEKIKVLPKCRHGFHNKCIDTWLVSNSTCPTCRQSLLEWAGNDAIVVSMDFGNLMNFSNNESSGGDAAQMH